MDSETRRAFTAKANRAELRRVQQQLRNLADKTQALADAVVTVTNNLASGLAAVNAKMQRFTTTVTTLVANVPQEVAVTWSPAWPDTAYGVWPTPITGAAATGAVFATLKPASKTTTGCTITVVATQAVASIGLDVLGVRT